MKNELVYRARLAKTDLHFARVHVNVNQFWLEFEKQYVRGMPFVMQNVVVRLADCMREHAVAHKPAIHKGILRIA